MPRRDLNDLLECFALALNIERQLLSLESNQKDFPEWDSFGQVAIAVRIESEFSIQFEKDELFAFHSVRDAYLILKNHMIEFELN